MTENSEGPGYLTTADPRLFEADLYIAAMGRSGSTHLANLLTKPPKRWLMVEPWFVRGVFNAAVKQRAAEFGWPIEKQYWYLPEDTRTHSAFLHRYETFLAPLLRALERWGVKEVRPAFHRPTITTINPKRIVILVRDLREVAASLLEKDFRQGKLNKERIDWSIEYCRDSAASLIGLSEDISDETTRIVRYEDFMRSPAERSAIEAWLDWPMDGDPFSMLEQFGRGYEIERHTASEKPVERQLPHDATQIVDLICEQNSKYQVRFGYMARGD